MIILFLKPEIFIIIQLTLKLIVEGGKQKSLEPQKLIEAISQLSKYVWMFSPCIPQSYPKNPKNKETFSMFKNEKRK